MYVTWKLTYITNACFLCDRSPNDSSCSVWSQRECQTRTELKPTLFVQLPFMLKYSRIAEHNYSYHYNLLRFSMAICVESTQKWAKSLAPSVDCNSSCNEQLIWHAGNDIKCPIVCGVVPILHSRADSSINLQACRFCLPQPSWVGRLIKDFQVSLNISCPVSHYNKSSLSRFFPMGLGRKYRTPSATILTYSSRLFIIQKLSHSLHTKNPVSLPLYYSTW